MVTMQLSKLSNNWEYDNNIKYHTYNLKNVLFEKYNLTDLRERKKVKRKKENEQKKERKKVKRKKERKKENEKN